MDAAREDIQISDVKFLPLVSAYATRIGLVEEIDRLLDCDMEVSPGRMVLAMILDALSGRRPLFRLQQFFADKDIDLLLGEDIPLSKLGDHTLRRVLMRLFDVGTNVALGAFPWIRRMLITTPQAIRSTATTSCMRTKSTVSPL
jgi:hypothetical protein